MDGDGTIPARQQQEARLQKWTFDTLSAVSDYRSDPKCAKDLHRTFTGQKKPSHRHVAESFEKQKKCASATRMSLAQ
jgi:hypothetical protein